MVCENLCKVIEEVAYFVLLVGNAKLDGLTKDLHFTGNQYLLTLTMYFVGYVSVFGCGKRSMALIGAGPIRNPVQYCSEKDDTKVGPPFIFFVYSD